MKEDKKAEPAREWLSVDELEDVQNKSWCLENCAYNLNALLTRKANGATSLEEFERRVRAEVVADWDELHALRHMVSTLDHKEARIASLVVMKNRELALKKEYRKLERSAAAASARIKGLEAKLAHVEKYYTV